MNKLLLIVLLLATASIQAAPFARWDAAEQEITGYKLSYWVNDDPATSVDLGVIQEYDLGLTLAPGDTVHVSVQSCDASGCGPFATAYLTHQFSISAPTGLRFVQ